MPPIIDARAGGTVALDAVSGTNQFSPALPATPTFGYVPAGATPTSGATYLGPTIEVARGAPLAFTVNNDVGEHPLAAYMDTAIEGVTALDQTAPRIAVHLHGGHTVPGSDGGPMDTFRPGGSATYQYVNDQEAGHLWFHDHALGITRLNVVAGLAGNYLVRDTFDTGRAGNPIGLPSGEYEIPLAIQDRAFNADGTFAYPLGPFAGQTPRPDYPDEWAPEFFGDVATVNGRAWPNLDVDRAIYRFRVLNGSDARFYHLSLRTGVGAPVRVRAVQVGAEGGLFDQAVELDELTLAPGERADVLVDFRSLPRGEKVVLTNDATVPFPDGDAAPGRGGVPLRSIMQFRGTGAAAATGQPAALPTVLRGGAGQPPVLPALTPTTVRTVLLNEILDPATGDPTEALINNLGFHEHHNGTFTIPRTTNVIEPAVNSVEEWEIVNTTGDTHPIHLHLTQFRVLNRQAFDADAYIADFNPALPAPSASDTGPWPPPPATPYLTGPAIAAAPNEAGWKDTVQAHPGEVTRIIVPFGGTAASVPAPFTGTLTGAETLAGTYVFHCHILEHEDNDMMQPYRVTAA